MSWQALLAVGSGGFLGAILRVYMGIIISRNYPFDIPLATLSINVLGSFLIGILVGLFILFTPPNELRLFLIVGFLGALTTYSTFAIETFFLFNTSIYLAILNILANVIVTIVAAGFGYKMIIYFLR
jgi:CrcB protein